MCSWLKPSRRKSHCSIFVRMKIGQSSGQPCHLLAVLFHIFSLPVHHNTMHNLDSTTFSKTTLYTVHLFQNLYSRQAALTNRSRTPIRRVAETRATPLPQVLRPRSLRQFVEVLRMTSINYTMYREFGEQDQQAPIIEEVKEFGVSQFIQTQSLRDHEMAETSPVEKMSYLQSQMHFEESMGSTADSDLEDGELQKLLASPLYAERASGKPDAMVVQQREASAQMSHSSEDHRASGKPAALFSPKRNEQRNQMCSSVFGKANLSNLSGTLLEGNKDHLLSQARSDLAKRELHFETLSKCIGDPQKRTEAHSRAPQDVQNELVESRREQTRLQQDLSRKEKALRDVLIRSKHEMGKMKRAQVQQVDEFSMQKLRDNHETIQQLTFQLQQMPEQMDSMSDSGEFQDVEPNCCGRLSHVSSQPEMIPSSRSLLSRDEVAAWYMESVWSTGERFWKSIFYAWCTSRFSSKKFIWRRAKKSRSIPWRSEGKNKSDKWRCLLPVFARRLLQKPKIVRKNQNTLPPHLPSQPLHEVEVCRGREVSEAKVTLGSFFDNRVDIIWRVPARHRLVNIGILPTVFFLQNRNGM